MVTLILVPTIFFTGFLADLARIKLYGNQAVMTADNYGEAVISDYDNLLKELYGLFAVAQSQEGKDALKELETYMPSSFKPNENRIASKYFAEAQAKWGSGDYEGFMPYQEAEVSISYQPAAGANLRNERVFMTQVGDFMRFRIVQQLAGNGEQVLKAIEQVTNMEGESQVIVAKSEVDEQIGKVLEKAKEYYELLKIISGYRGFIKNINTQYKKTKEEYKKLSESPSFQTYKDFKTHEAEIVAAIKREKNLADGESLSEEDQKLVDMGKAYDADKNAKEMKQNFEKAHGWVKAAGASDPVNFSNYKELVTALNIKATEVKKELGKFQTAKKELEKKLDENTVDEYLEKGIREDLEKVGEIFGTENGYGYKADDYINLASEIRSKNIILHDVNAEYKEAFNGIDATLGVVKDEYLTFAETLTEYKPPLTEGKDYDFRENAHYESFYQKLKGYFGGSKGEEEERYKNKKGDANTALSNKEKEAGLDKDEVTNARDIPASFGYGEADKGGGFLLTELIKNAADYFKLNSFKEAGNMLLLKLFTVSYDFGMFSSRITNHKEGQKEDEKAVSLTGVPMGPNVNYLYGAELEYILGGNNSSVKNLNLARNWILAFRGVVNMRATYRITEINTAINAIRDICNGFIPGLGFAVAGALRLAVAGLETYADWAELKDGKSVILMKNKLDDLKVYDQFKNLIECKKEQGTKTKDDSELSLDYEQYLMVMVIFMTTSEQAARRTGNLIELNMNAVKQDIGSEKGKTLGPLAWHLSDGVTAVDATCSVHLNFVFMPDGFAKQMTKGAQYDAIKQFEKNAYKFTVTRGY